MNLKFEGKIPENQYNFFRRLGYRPITSKHTGDSYVRPIGRDFYPRFHIYIKQDEPLIFNLHLDQKRASYEGQKAHSAEYQVEDSPRLEQEAKRIYSYWQSLLTVKEPQSESPVEPGKKSFWQKIFG